MTRLFLTSAPLLTALFALLLAVVRLQPQDDPVMAALGGCDVLCWQGIEPGVTAPEDALRQLAAAYHAPAEQGGCFAPPSRFCARFTWHSKEAMPAAELVIDHGAIEALIVEPAGFTLGEALLSLSHLRGGLVGATDPSTANGHFYFQLVFDEAHLVLMLAPVCAGGYFSLMQTPVRSVSINVPLPPVEQQFLEQTFTAVQRRWHRLCER